MTPENRRKLTRENRLCYNCLRLFQYAIGCTYHERFWKKTPHIASLLAVHLKQPGTKANHGKNLEVSVQEQDIDTGSVLPSLAILVIQLAIAIQSSAVFT